MSWPAIHEALLFKKENKCWEKKPERNILRFVQTGSHYVVLVDLGFAMETSLSASAPSAGDDGADHCAGLSRFVDL